MGHRRTRPEHLAAKLLAIRDSRKASQSEMVQLLRFQVTGARISEYEHGKRQPNLLVLLTYARLAKVPVEQLIDDDLQLTLE